MGSNQSSSHKDEVSPSKSLLHPPSFMKSWSAPGGLNRHESRKVKKLLLLEHLQNNPSRRKSLSEATSVPAKLPSSRTPFRKDVSPFQNRQSFINTANILVHRQRRPVPSLKKELSGYLELSWQDNNWQQCYVVCRSGLLFCFREKEDFISGLSKHLNPPGPMDLRGCRILPLSNRSLVSGRNEKDSSTFEVQRMRSWDVDSLHRRTSSAPIYEKKNSLHIFRSLFFRAKDGLEMEKWVNLLRQIILEREVYRENSKLTYHQEIDGNQTLLPLPPPMLVPNKKNDAATFISPIPQRKLSSGKSPLPPRLHKATAIRAIGKDLIFALEKREKRRRKSKAKPWDWQLKRKMLRKLARQRSFKQRAAQQRRRRRSIELGLRVPPTAAKLRAILVSKGIILSEAALNYDPVNGVNSGTAKGCVVFRANPEIVLLYKLPVYSATVDISFCTMQNEIDIVKQMRDDGCIVPDIYTDVFTFSVDGHKTFGYLCQNVTTLMVQPYKPQCHRETLHNIKGRLFALPTLQLRIALEDLDVIGQYTKCRAFVHDLQILLQDFGPVEQRGHIFVIDPGYLRSPNGDQVKRLRTIVINELKRREKIQKLEENTIISRERVEIESSSSMLPFPSRPKNSGSLG
eukprot:g1305.t1